MHKTQAVSMEERSNNSCSSEGSIDLDLSAGSSIFEGIDSNIQLGTQPYLFEPEADIDEEATTGNSPSPASNNSDRLGNNSCNNVALSLFLFIFFLFWERATTP